MKKFFKSAMLFAAAAMAFTACSDDDTTEVMPQDEGVRFNVEANIESQTRVEVTGDGGELAWVADKDDILLQYFTEGQTIQKTFLYNNKGTFELNYGTLPTPTAGDKFYATSPSSQYDKNAFAIKAKQTNTYSAEKGFNFDQVPLVAAPFAFEQSMMNGNEVNLSLAMRHVASYIQIRFVTEKAEYKNLEVASVMFEDKQGKAVAGQLDRSIVSMDDVPASGNFWMGMTSSSMDATVAFETNYPTVADKTAAADRTNVAYMVVYPGEYLGKFTVKTTDGKTFEVVAPQVKTFARGTVNRIALNLKTHSSENLPEPEPEPEITAINPANIDFSDEGGEQIVTITVNEHFNAEKHEYKYASEMFTITPVEGQSHQFKITAAVNEDKVNAKSETIKFAIVNKGSDVELTSASVAVNQAKATEKFVRVVNLSDIQQWDRILICKDNYAMTSGAKGTPVGRRTINVVNKKVAKTPEIADAIWFVMKGEGANTMSFGSEANQGLFLYSNSYNDKAVQSSDVATIFTIGVNGSSNFKFADGSDYYLTAGIGYNAGFVNTYEAPFAFQVYRMAGEPVKVITPITFTTTPASKSTLTFKQDAVETKAVSVSISGGDPDKTYDYTADLSGADAAKFQILNKQVGSVEVATIGANNTTVAFSATLTLTVTENGQPTDKVATVMLSQTGKSEGGNKPTNGFRLIEMNETFALKVGDKVAILAPNAAKITTKWQSGTRFLEAPITIPDTKVVAETNVPLYFTVEVATDGKICLSALYDNWGDVSKGYLGAFLGKDAAPTTAWTIQDGMLVGDNGTRKVFVANNGSMYNGVETKRLNDPNWAAWSSARILILPK